MNVWWYDSIWYDFMRVRKPSGKKSGQFIVMSAPYNGIMDDISYL